MKTAEEYIYGDLSRDYSPRDVIDNLTVKEVYELIEQVQTDAYNQALDDAAENARTMTNEDSTSVVVDKQSILKLKK